MEEALIQCFLQLRISIGFLGEDPQRAWWNTNMLSETGLQFLRITFPRTSLAAGCNAVTEAARKLHDSRIGKGRVFHLFRMPYGYEEKMHRHLLSSDQNGFAQIMESEETAIEGLRDIAEAASTEVQAVEGPIHMGKVKDIQLPAVVAKTASLYLYAFRQDIQIFPYFTE